jgi:hypothetical protein
MAAGLGFKDFVTGEVLTAADVDGYLMQGVWVFASAAARDAAVTSPQEGNFAYLKDTNVTTYYTGSAWANLDTTGMTNPMTTTGDTIYSSSGSTPARLGIGSTGNVLTVAGGVPTWAAPAGGGGYTSLASGTFSTSATSLDLTSISGSYQNLVFICRNLRQSTDNEITLRLNGSGVGYTFILLDGDNATFTGAASNSQSKFYGTYNNMESATTMSLIMTVFDYANTSANKLVQIQSQFEKSNAGTFESTFTTGSWRNTAAVNQITIFAPGTFSAGTYELFGIK